MKIFYTLSLLFPFVIYSQITITSSDMPDANDTFRVSIINGIDTIDLDNTGPNSVWDYSFLQFETQKVDSFVKVTTTPWGYQMYFNNPLPDPWGYPDHYSNYAQRKDPPPTFNPNFQVDEVYYFYKESSDQFAQTGFGAQLNGFPMSQRYIPVDVIYEFPLDYEDTSSCVSEFGMLIPMIGYYGRQTERKNTVDGWGTLTTPFGTFQTLRVRTELNLTDTLYIDTIPAGYSISRPKDFEFKWLANGEGIPVLQINVSEYLGALIINEIRYRDSVRMDFVSVQGIEYAVSEMTTFPNPNNGSFILSGGFDPSKNSFPVEIYNAIGEQVYSINYSCKTQDCFSVVETKLSDGIYFLRTGSKMQKLVVSR